MRGTLNNQSLIYLQIARMLEDDILRGVYREEEQYKRRGIGMFVSKGAGETVKQKRKAAFYDGYVKPLVKEGASLALTGEEITAMIERAVREENDK